jgi:hypothetical protein
MQCFSGHRFSGWACIHRLIFGIVAFGPGTYWLASR